MARVTDLTLDRRQLREIRNSVIGRDISAARYTMLDTGLSALDLAASLHPADMNVRLGLGGRELCVAWAMQGIDGYLTLDLGDHLTVGARHVEVIDATGSIYWLGLAGQPISDFRIIERVLTDRRNYGSQIFAVEFETFDGGYVAMALGGARGDRIEFDPESIVVAFQTEVVQRYLSQLRQSGEVLTSLTQ